MARCGVCKGTISEDTLVKHAFYCEDDRKAPSLGISREINDIEKERIESESNNN